ncbi:MAG: hypothetical protein LQ348_002517 [Seirophora lacunosa]|nr:MAG: hypothetical protein LQ348_002517 [Seirophora lacunosa]
MDSPFKQRLGLKSKKVYSGVELCILLIVIHQNQAAAKAANQDPEHGWTCAICQDDSVDTGKTGHMLACSMLKCSHRFHESCLMQWLSPIQLPATHRITSGSSSSATSPLASSETHPAGNLAQNTTPALDGAVPQETQSRARRHVSFDDMTPRQQTLVEDLRRIRVVSFADMTRRQQVLAVGLRRLGSRQQPLSRQMTTAEEPTALNNSVTEAGALREEQPQQRVADTNALANPASRPQGQRNVAPKYACPLCRQPAFPHLPTSCSDTVQLLRVRRRLTDFAYALLGIQHNSHEEWNREQMVKFLDRRYADTLASGEAETVPALPEARNIFKQARVTLSQYADRYMRLEEDVSDSERDSIRQIIRVFDNFNLEEEHVAFFFDPNPELDTSNFMVRLSEEEMQVLRQYPVRFFSELEIVLAPKAADGGRRPTG